MKRVLASILTLIMLLNLAACATNDNTPPTVSDSIKSSLPAVSDNAEKNLPAVGDKMEGFTVTAETKT